MSASVRIGINGFGRMGRLALRAAFGRSEFQWSHINEVGCGAATSAHLLEFDSVHGRWDKEVLAEGDSLTIEGRTLPHTSHEAIADTDWSGCDIVLECTGAFRTVESLAPYFDQGVRKVIVAAPVKGEEALNIVFGINDADYDPKRHRLLTAASCTTNCLAPLAKVLNDKWGIKRGLMTTVHAATATQKTVDGPSMKDWRGGRGILENIIPSSTGAAKAVGVVLPELNGKLTGMAFRVPTPTVSAVDLTVKTEKDTSLAEINAPMKKASETYLKDILGYTEDEVASSDFIHDPLSSIYYAGSSIELNSSFFKLVSWYDNEWGYSCRVCDLLARLKSA